MGRLKNFDRNDVLDAAIQLFWKKGYADTSLSDLEKATGVNKSGLYSEFKDKDDIFFESLKRYRDNNPSLEILSMEPLGWKNIESFFRALMTCKGQKGCFVANTLREHSIIPLKIKQMIEQNSNIAHEQIVKNVKATGTKKDPVMLANLISTFAVGMSLKLNAMKPEQLTDDMMSFLEMCKK
jgi:AcrR family transcriptional regulator